MNKDQMKGYYEKYNQSVNDAFETYYADDAVFEYQDLKLEGKKAIFAHFADIQDAFKEVMTPLNILIDGDRAAVEVESKMQAKIDIPDFLGRGPLMKGETLTAKFSGFYDLRGDKIRHIRIYTY